MKIKIMIISMFRNPGEIKIKKSHDHKISEN